MGGGGGERSGGCSGGAVPHLDVGIRDDDGSGVPAGQVGEIGVRDARRGPWAGEYTPMLGYWQDAAVERFEAQELHTGDIGVLDGAGNLFVRERKKLGIIRGGANVYPAEVERVLERVPGVRSSAVIGLPDPRLGERGVSAIEAGPRFAV